MKSLKVIDPGEKDKLNPFLLNIIAYRKSGLSLNHIIGCPLDCAYCVRHFFGNFEMKEPHLLCTDEDAVQQLIAHPFFMPNITPIQLFNRATDPFLTTVREHTHRVLSLLDKLALKNQVLIITRAKVSRDDLIKLEKLKHIKVNILVTYSGIVEDKIEPIAKSRMTVKSIETISKYKNKTKLILYWRPIVHGWNDDLESFNRVFNMAKYVDAIVYTGYYHRPENYEYLKSIAVEIPYGDFARRKFLPSKLENKILKAYKNSGLKIPLFRKTSCGIAFVQKIPDYNGHWGVNEICDICPKVQKDLCKGAYNAPTNHKFQKLLDSYNYETPFLIEDGHVWTEGLGEERRYHIQHTLGFQVWDIEKPHFKTQHGRSTFGHLGKREDKEWYENMKVQFLNTIKEDDD